MKRSFLSSLGIESDKIDAIMSEYGKTVSDLKDTLADKSQELETVKASLDKFKDVDIEALKQEAANAKADKEKAINDFKLDMAIDKAFAESKAKHSDLLRGKIDRDKLSFDKEGNLKGLDEQVSSLKESYKDLFETSEESKPEVAGASPAQGATTEPNQTLAQEVARFMGIKQ